MVLPPYRKDYRDLSLWFDTLAETVEARPSLPGDLDTDVAVVGAGYTGLWAAYYLRRSDPTLRVAVVEQEVAGYGASGRNGGWASALFACSPERLARLYGLDAMHAMRLAMQASLDELERVLAEESIDCDWARGGTLTVARNDAQLARARQEVDSARELGIPAADLALLGPREAGERLRVAGTLGATFTPHCAAVHPARLARGLARAVERRGAALYERTRVLEIVPSATASGPPSPGRRRGARLRTTHGTVRAEVVVRATEAWTTQLPGSRRALAPVYSLMIATEPLDEATLSAIGGADRPTFADHRNLVIYGQRTGDGRIAFGGRGAPYHFGSDLSPLYEREPRVHARLRETLVELFPSLAGVMVTHAWGGPIGIPRDWHSSVGFDRPSGLAWAGGYVGDGVTTANLAGRTLADLVLGHESDLIRLPWVGHRSPCWEPEPLRFLGVNAGLVATMLADRSEQRSGRPSRLPALLSRLIGTP